MKYIKYYEELNKELAEEVNILYKDSNLICMIPKSQKASKIYGKGTNWCQTKKMGFITWTGISGEENSDFYETPKNEKMGFLIRFLFKNDFKGNKKGRKIRFTYNPSNNDFHWANENGKHVLIENGDNFFDVVSKRKNSSTERDIIYLISKIPEECKQKVKDYIQSNKNKNPSDIYLNNKEEFYSLAEEKLEKEKEELIKKYSLSYFPITIFVSSNRKFVIDFHNSEDFTDQSNLNLNQLEKEIQYYLSKLDPKFLVFAKELDKLDKYKSKLNFVIKIYTASYFSANITLVVQDRGYQSFSFEDVKSCENKIKELIKNEVSLKYYEELNKELSKEVDIIYKDPNLVCLMPKSQKASKIYGNKTDWCQTKKDGFETHTKTLNTDKHHYEVNFIIRFIFKKEKKKIRFTYYPFKNSFYWAKDQKHHLMITTGCDFFNPKPLNIENVRWMEQSTLELIAKIPQECRDKVNTYINLHKGKKANNFYTYRSTEYKTNKENKK